MTSPTNDVFQRSTGPQRRRSVLSVPASEPRKVRQALGSAADDIVIDLEDAVPPSEKQRARICMVDALRDGPQGQRSVSVRINAPGTPWCRADLDAVAEARTVAPVSVVVPKVEQPQDLALVERHLEQKEGNAETAKLQALIETAAGLARVGEIARWAGSLESLILGYADLAASLGRLGTAATLLDLWLPAQHAVLVAARAASIQAIDGPHLGVELDDSFTAAVQRAVDIGFDGKWVIHPRQVAAVNHAFSPTEDEVAHARDVLEVLERAADQGAGAANLDGQMLDEAVATAARLVLARAEDAPRTEKGIM